MIKPFWLCFAVSFSPIILGQVRIVDPVAGAYLSGEYEVVLATPRQADQIARTEVYLDGKKIFERYGWASSFTHDFGEAMDRHELYAVVYDVNGQQHSSAVVITKELRVDLSTTARVILMSAVVKTKGNKPITGLEKDQFRVFENGKPVMIETFYNEYVPLDLVFLLDTSSSLRIKGIDVVKSSASVFLKQLEEGDRVNLFEFKRQPIQLVGFTTDRKRLVGHIQKLEAIGETALFDALHAALSQLKGRRKGRKAIVLFTDGRDSVYEEPREKARMMRSGISKAQNQEVTIYTIGLGRHIHKEAMARLAEETGGRFHYADKAGKLPSIFAEIVLDLKHQYILGITPRSKGSGFNRMEVKVKKRGAVVYARKGYTRE